jgi:hypothetical protein
MSNEFKDWISDFTEEQKKNYELCMKYPILIPHNNDDEWQYEYTMLDFFPTGYNKAFGEQWAQEVQAAINKMPIYVQREACIVGAKEKWGKLFVSLSVYSNELDEVLKKYEKLSEHVCVNCGKFKTEGFGGWISYLCNDCERELMERRNKMRGWADGDSQN